MNKIDKLGWLCIKEKQLLVARSEGKDVYYIPGGKREKNESDQASLIREIKEELSVDLLPASIRYVETFESEAHGKSANLAVKVTCYFADFIGQVKASAEIEAISWVNHRDKDKCSSVTQIIMDWLKAKEMIE